MTRSPGHPMDTEVRRLDLVFELRAIVARHEREIAALRVEVSRLHRGHAATADQAELVRAAFEALGDVVFTAAELLARALRTDAAGLRLAALFSGCSVKSVGRRLGSAAGKLTSSGLTLRRVGGNRTCAFWCITAR